MKSLLTALAISLFLFIAGCAEADLAQVQPGISIVTNPYKWDTRKPTPELQTLFTSFKSPAEVAAYMQTNFEWRDDYDTGVFISSQDVYENKRAVCSGFARFWRDALIAQGFNPRLLAFWGAESAHAVVIFEDAEGQYKLCSNQFYSPEVVLGNRYEAAQVAAAMNFYGSSYRVVNSYEEGGVILQRLPNEKIGFTIPLAPPTPSNGKTVFSIKDR